MSGEVSQQFLIARIGDEERLLPLASVREILPAMELAMPVGLGGICCGISNLRGFYSGRFTGKSMAYDNLELRLKLFDYTSYIAPGTLGIVAFNDIGRVWTPGESSNQWHDGYGGGFYLIPAQLVLVQAVVGFSKDGAYPYISAGFRF